MIEGYGPSTIPVDVPPQMSHLLKPNPDAMDAAIKHQESVGRGSRRGGGGGAAAARGAEAVPAAAAAAATAAVRPPAPLRHNQASSNASQNVDLEMVRALAMIRQIELEQEQAKEEEQSPLVATGRRLAATGVTISATNVGYDSSTAMHATPAADGGGAGADASNGAGADAGAGGNAGAGKERRDGRHQLQLQQQQQQRLHHPRTKELEGEAKFEWASQVLKSWKTAATISRLRPPASNDGNSSNGNNPSPSSAPPTSSSSSAAAMAAQHTDRGGGTKMRFKLDADGGYSVDVDGGDRTKVDVESTETTKTLPDIDSRSQLRVRRKLLMQQMDRLLPPILAGLGVAKAATRTEVAALVDTFELHMDQVSFKPAELAVLVVAVLAAIGPRRMPELYNALAKPHPTYGTNLGWWAARLKLSAEHLQNLAGVLVSWE